MLARPHSSIHPPHFSNGAFPSASPCPPLPPGSLTPAGPSILGDPTAEEDHVARPPAERYLWLVLEGLQHLLRVLTASLIGHPENQAHFRTKVP